MTKIIIATNNAGKVKEIKDFFNDLPFEMVSLKDIDLNIQINEDQPDFARNSFKKASEISKVTDEIVLADDSGLEVDALDGRPGVYSARFAGENATDMMNNDKLLFLLKDIPENKRTAQFKCVVTLYSPDGKYIQSEGICPGSISFSPIGEGGFGYDPIFILDAYNKTMAELSIDEKNSVSHRGYALKALKDLLLRKRTDEK